MTGKTPYPSTCSWHHHLLRIAGMICFFTLFNIQTSFAYNKPGDDEPIYDEISVFITVPGLGSVEVPAIIYRETAFLSITSVFDFLKIRNSLSPTLDSITGFILDPQAGFLIDKKNNRIDYKEKTFDLGNDGLMKTESNLFLRTDYFGIVFGLDCIFNFRSLSVILNTKLELPAIREMRIEAMHNNMNQLKGDMKVDTSIGRSKQLFHVGMADWAVFTTQTTKELSNTRVSLAVGAIIAGGETNIAFNYYNNLPFSERQQYYLWRLVDNDRPALRQVMAGKINSQAASSIYSPVVGVQFTNTPTTYRRSYGSYMLSDHTEPNWMVELYVNNVLVNYVKADAAGFFTFEVPLVYGNTSVKIRYYGPFGEERFTEQNINIPFNFVPKNQFEYTVSAGMVEDTLHSRYSRASFNYGLGKRLSVGGGIEHLSSVVTGKDMPFVNVSARLASNLLIGAEYIYNVRMRDVLSYRLPSNLQFELLYTRYKKGQRAINNNFLEERRAIVSYPFRSNKVSIFSRLTVYQIVLPSSKYTNAEAIFSSVFFGVSLNTTTYAILVPESDIYWYSNISSSLRLPGKLTFTPQIQYEHNKNKIISLKGELNRQLSWRGYVNVFYENNFKSQFRSIGVGFRYDFSLAQLSFTARHGNQTNTTTQAASGSLIYNRSTSFFGVSNRTSVGRGGLAIIPFLDLNGNGKRDKNEPKVFGLTVQINGGKIKYSKSDTTTFVTNLEAYISYVVKFSTTAFDNVAWQILKKTYSITIDPNLLKLIEVPVSIIGEASGMVMMEESNGKKVLGRILVNFYNSDSVLVGHTQSEADGYFSFSGLKQGSYTAAIDTAQLRTLKMTSLTGSIPFTISSNQDGDVIDNLEFVLKHSQGISPAKPLETP